MLAALMPKDVAPDVLLATDDAGEKLYYGDLPGLAANWGERLPGRRLVALFCSNTVPSLRAYIGLQAAGHVVVLLSAKMSEQARSALIARYGFEASVDGDRFEILADPADNLHHDLSVCLSTSGSTGSPKLVRFSAKQLRANAEAIAQYLELSSEDAPLAHLPFEYSYGLSVLHSHMTVGATCLLTEHSVMQKPFWERLSQATSFSGVPFHFEMLLRMRIARQELPRLRVLTQAGGKLGQKEAEAIFDLARQKGWKFHIMYGQTEAGPRISWLPFDELEGHLDFIGKPIPGVSITLADDGEMTVHSPAVMMGYAEQREDLALGDEMRGVLSTGDIAEQSGGLFRITGRKNRFIKLQGNRVSLADVEAQMEREGHHVHCVGRDDLLTVFTTSHNLDDVRAAAVRLFSFPARSMEIRGLAEVPRRANDKVDYAALAILAAEPS